MKLPFVSRARLHREVADAAETYRLASEAAQERAASVETEAFAAAADMIRSVTIQPSGNQSLEVHLVLSRYLVATSSDEVIADYIAREIVRTARATDPS